MALLHLDICFGLGHQAAIYHGFHAGSTAASRAANEGAGSAGGAWMVSHDGLGRRSGVHRATGERALQAVLVLLLPAERRRAAAPRTGGFGGVMDLIQLVVVLIVVGLILWLIQNLPIAPPIKNVIVVLVVLIVILWLLSLIGLIGSGPVLRHRIAEGLHSYGV